MRPIMLLHAAGGWSHENVGTDGDLCSCVHCMYLVCTLSSRSAWWEVDMTAKVPQLMCVESVSPSVLDIKIFVFSSPLARFLRWLTGTVGRPRPCSDQQSFSEAPHESFRSSTAGLGSSGSQLEPLGQLSKTVQSKRASLTPVKQGVGAPTPSCPGQLAIAPSWIDRLSQDPAIRERTFFLVRHPTWSCFLTRQPSHLARKTLLSGPARSILCQAVPKAERRRHLGHSG